MTKARPLIDRLENGILQLRFDSDANWTDMLAGVEALSERNPSGQPVNYLLEFAGTASFSDQGRSENIAEFFVQFVPARSAVAIVTPIDITESPGGIAFRTTLAAAGFLTCCFHDHGAAQFWLALHPPKCGSTRQRCGVSCEDAFTSDCPSSNIAETA